jgi:hypothetical protein
LKYMEAITGEGDEDDNKDMEIPGKSSFGKY